MIDESIFTAAIAINDPAERAEFVNRVCPDPAQQMRVAELLVAHAESNPLDRPVRDLYRTGGYVPGTDHTSTAIVGDRIGPYKLLEKIGEGGMGEVWVADQLEPIKRRVALKLIKPGMDSRSVLGRFEAERQALAVMDHPNIAKVLDAGTATDGRPYFVMELVKGTPITEFCDARKLTPKQRLELFVPVCLAIQHAHMKGIIHRDIKPSNVLVELHDETPVPKVIDFGVAKAIGQQLTEKTIYTGFGALVGTPAYMAPEQASFNALDVDTRADVYALGVLLYELLTGSPPIETDRVRKAALDEVLRMVRDEEPPRPSQRLSTSQARASIAATRQSDPVKLSALMKGEIDWIVMKALEKDRTRRYDSANGLAADVRRYLTGDSVEACPPTLRYRLGKAYRKNLAAVWVTIAFLLLLSVAFALSSWLAVKARRAEEVAVIERDHTREAFEIEQRARRRFRSVYRTSSVDLFRTVYMVDRDGVELIAFQNNCWKTIHMIRMLTDDYIAETGKSPAAKVIRAEGLMWRGVDHYGGMLYSEAFDSFHQAEAIYLELLAGPNRGDTQADLTNCRMLAAFAALSAKRSSEANSLAIRAETDARILSDANPDNPEYRYELALILWQMHTYRSMAGDETIGISPLQEASQLFVQLVRSHPQVLHYRTGSANVLLAIASEYKRLKESAQAIRLFGETAAVLEEIQAPAPEPVPMLRKWAFRGRARLLTEASRHAEAARDWNRVVDESPEPQLNPYDRSEWALSLARSGQFAAARQHADQVSRSSTFSAAYRNAAQVFTMSMADSKTAPEREIWAAKAVAMLRKCQDISEDWGLHSDDIFEPIRRRPDFQELLEEVRRKAKLQKGQ